MTYDLAELCRLTGVTPRTVRYYIQQGLLPSSASTGPGAHYGPVHLERLQLIRKLQKEHLPLAEIRQRLSEMDAAPAANGSAADYVRKILGGSASPSPTPAIERSTWERIRIDADVEIHVRRPLSRDQNRRLDRLLEQAREIFEDP